MVTFLGDVRFGEGFSFNGQYCGGEEKSVSAVANGHCTVVILRGMPDAGLPPIPSHHSHCFGYAATCSEVS